MPAMVRGAAFKPDVVLGGADLGRAAGLDDVLLIQRVQHVCGREAFGLQALGVEVDHDRALLAAVDVGDDGAGNGDQLRPDEVQAVVVELLLGEALAGKAELKNGNAGGGEIDDLRRKNARRKLPQFELARRTKPASWRVSSEAPGCR